MKGFLMLINWSWKCALTGVDLILLKVLRLIASIWKIKWMPFQGTAYGIIFPLVPKLFNRATKRWE